MKLKNIWHKIFCLLEIHKWEYVNDTDIEKCEFCGVYKDHQDWWFI